MGRGRLTKPKDRPPYSVDVVVKAAIPNVQHAFHPSFVSCCFTNEAGSSKKTPLLVNCTGAHRKHGVLDEELAFLLRRCMVIVGGGWDGTALLSKK